MNISDIALAAILAKSMGNKSEEPKIAVWQALLLGGFIWILILGGLALIIYYGFIFE